MENLVTLQQLAPYFQNKKAFVTGHTGFKGAWLTACLHLLGTHTKGYALEPDHKNGLFDLMQPLRITDSVIADIRDKDRLQKELNAFQPDFIFHLAAQPLVRRSYEIPAETFEVNVAGTANLLEAASRLSNKCTIVVITTDKVYENKEQHILYREDDQLGGYDPYSASKACTELVINSFRNSFFNISKYDRHQKGIASARAGNVIGGGDWNRDRIVPDMVKALQNESTIDVRNPNAVRPWQHVLEPMCGYLLLAGLLHRQPANYSKAYNFGPLPEDHLTVRDLVQTAIAHWGKGSWKDVSDNNQPHEAGLLQLDINRAMQELGWKPKLNAAAAIQWTIDWYKKPLAEQADYTFQQINNYFAI